MHWMWGILLVYGVAMLLVAPKAKNAGGFYWDRNRGGSGA